jgi:flagellar motor switch protein FliM
MTRQMSDPVASTDERLRQTPRRGPRVRAVDFSRPTKFTTDQERRLTRSLEAFGRSASTRLSAEMRVPIELEVVNSTQLNWANAHAQLPQESICGVVEVHPLGTSMLLAVERPLALAAIDLLLGGSVDDPPVERRLSDIDWVLARHFFDALIAQLSVIWSDMAALELNLAALESHLETAQVAPVSEPTLSLTLEAQVGRASATLALLVPYAAVAPALSKLSYSDRVRPEDDPAVANALNDVEVELRAEVAAVALPIEEVLALAPGSLVALDAPASSGATLYAGEVPVCRVRPGRVARRRAVQVLDGEEGA